MGISSQRTDVTLNAVRAHALAEVQPRPVATRYSRVAHSADLSRDSQARVPGLGGSSRRSRQIFYLSLGPPASKTKSSSAMVGRRESLSKHNSRQVAAWTRFDAWQVSMSIRRAFNNPCTIAPGPFVPSSMEIKDDRTSGRSQEMWRCSATVASSEASSAVHPLHGACERALRTVASRSRRTVRASSSAATARRPSRGSAQDRSASIAPEVGRRAVDAMRPNVPRSSRGITVSSDHAFDRSVRRQHYLQMPPIASGAAPIGHGAIEQRFETTTAHEAREIFGW